MEMVAIVGIIGIVAIVAIVFRAKFLAKASDESVEMQVESQD